ncbi:uncharacterized protein VTP21DRAFT_2179 [Calcarisporiella thermophila]|uniref:uncharacterized protein n=1 Tax=Calcarisporiella thermophila TaxID=911321 RepID=UPI00374367D5
MQARSIPLLSLTLHWCLTLVFTTAAAADSPQPPSSSSSSAPPSTGRTFFFPPATTNGGISAHDTAGSRAVFAAGIISGFANVLVAGYFIYWAVKTNRKRSHGRSFIPAYMAVFELVPALFTIANLLSAMSRDHVMAQPECGVVGAIIYFFINAGLALVGCFALTIYLRLCHQSKVVLGYGDCGIVPLALLVPILLTVTSAVTKGYGDDMFWCFVDNRFSGGTLSNAASVVLVYFVLVVITVSYIKVVNQLYSPKTNMSQVFRAMHIPTKESNASKNRTLHANPAHYNSDCVRMLSMRLSSYILVFLLQYAPLSIYGLCLLVDYRRAWIYVTMLVALHVGGMVKLFLYSRAGKAEFAHAQNNYITPLISQPIPQSANLRAAALASSPYSYPEIPPTPPLAPRHLQEEHYGSARSSSNIDPSVAPRLPSLPPAPQLYLTGFVDEASSEAPTHLSTPNQPSFVLPNLEEELYLYEDNYTPYDDAVSSAVYGQGPDSSTFEAPSELGTHEEQTVSAVYGEFSDSSINRGQAESSMYSRDWGGYFTGDESTDDGAALRVEERYRQMRQNNYH